MKLVNVITDSFSVELGKPPLYYVLPDGEICPIAGILSLEETNRGELHYTCRLRNGRVVCLFFTGRQWYLAGEPGYSSFAAE